MQKKRKNLLVVGIVVRAIDQDMVLVLICGVTEVEAGISINVDPVGKRI